MKSKYSTKELLIIITIVILSSLSTFGAGFTVRSLLTPQATPQPTSGPESSPNSSPREQTSFLPDKHYLQDTIFVINKNDPHETLIATVSRGERKTDFVQNTRVSYFDGKNWSRELTDQNIGSAGIFSNRIIKNWQVDINPTRVLKEEASGTIQMQNTTLSFVTNELQNEIGMRSLPGYTKFMSRSEGTLTINNKSVDAYVLYTHLYSLNAADIQFYNEPLGVTTEWVAFWDNQNNFYHIDKTNVTRKTEIYDSHEIGVKVTPDSTVSKTFYITSSRDSDKDPLRFQFIFGSPISDKLEVQRLNLHNKSPNLFSIWQMSQVKGTITTQSGKQIPGFGIAEYIKD